MIEKKIEAKITLTEKVWDELHKRYGDKWQQHINNLLERDLFGKDLIHWLQKKVEETGQK